MVGGGGGAVDSVLESSCSDVRPLHNLMCLHEINQSGQRNASGTENVARFIGKKLKQNGPICTPAPSILSAI